MIPDIDQLSIDQRLDLISQLWDSLEKKTSVLPVPDWHKRGLDERWSTYERDGNTLSAEDFMAGVTEAIERRK